MTDPTAERLKALVAEYGRKYPWAWKFADSCRSNRGKELPDWPDWCFLPMGGWDTIVFPGNLSILERVQNLDKVKDVQILASLGAWRLTQGIYRLHPDLMRSLMETEMTGNIPSDILTRLPEWSIYVEETVVPEESQLRGFFLNMEYDGNSKSNELRILIDFDWGFVGIPIPLGDWSLDEALQRMIEIGKKHQKRVDAEPSGFHFEKIHAGMIFDKLLVSEGNNAPEMIASLLSGMLNVALYICSANAEIGPGKPTYASPTKTKKGLRYFPADKVRVWDVGFHTGAALKRARESEESIAQLGREQDPTERHRPRPHIRKAHWHSYWTGPRNGERKIEVKWLPPKGINIQLGEIIPTIHEVE